MERLGREEGEEDGAEGGAELGRPARDGLGRTGFGSSLSPPLVEVDHLSLGALLWIRRTEELRHRLVRDARSFQTADLRRLDDGPSQVADQALPEAL